jgi:hypothetical protein
MRLSITQNASSELTEQDVVRCLVLGVEFESRTLEVLHCIRFAVFERLDNLLADPRAIVLAVGARPI